MKGFIYTLSAIFILLFLFYLFLINYISIKNISFYQGELLGKLKEKEDLDYILTGLKLIAKNSKTEEDFIKNLALWEARANIQFITLPKDIIIDKGKHVVFFYSNKTLFKNYLKIKYDGKEYTFNNITF